MTRTGWLVPLACALALGGCQGPPDAPSPTLTGLPAVGVALAAARDQGASDAQVATLEAAAAGARDVTFAEYRAAADDALACLNASPLIGEAGIHESEHEGTRLLSLWIDASASDEVDDAYLACIDEHLAFVEGAWLQRAAATMSP